MMRLKSLTITDLLLKQSLRQITTGILLTLIASVVVIVFIELSTNSALAQTKDEVTLELIPESAELPAKGDAEVQLVLRNHTASTLQKVRLYWFTSTNVSVTPAESQDLELLAPQTENVWSLKLAHGEEGLIPGKIQFRVSYQMQVKGAPSVARVSYGSLEVKGRDADAADKVAEVAVKTSGTTLNEEHAGKGFLIVTNKSNQEIRVKEIPSSDPKTSIKIESELKGIHKVAPHDSLSIPVNITVTDAVEPGKQILVFQVPIEWGEKEQLQTASLVAPQEFNIGVFGESEILTALGVPSFLILPGFLMIVAFGMVGGRKETENPLFKVGASPQFWVIAITLSIFMALLYPVFTELTSGVRRNYLEAYGLKDVVRVWFISITLGVVARGLIYMVRLLIASHFTPSSGDAAIKIIKKLRWQGLGIYLPQVGIKIGDADVTAFPVQERKDGQQTLWVAPFINLTWQEGVDAESKRLVALQMEQGGSISELYRLLKRGQKKNKLTLDWERTGIIKGPRLISKTELTGDETGKQSIIK